ncbi:aldo/keto reductase family protein [Alicyclobacillus tolerans]|uniref:aldo/keto reductase family protein n=1 Tax=Alicyclobacillus tolerans TaxID=90970 RepID=UPI001F35FDA0|nr:aldo/keto reductase family protein [Alicyclobacillus tolerans]MCF8563936.1 aldo/keto reductase family protein [Alicyclobacillus tolerans]
MKYRKLGRSGLKVSEIALGSWLTYGAAVDTGVAKECIRTAYDLGINFFDTANAYNRGAAEEVVGSVLRDYPRESYVLATKVYFPMGDGPNDRGLSRKHIVEQCNASLKRLGVDYVDLYQCHRFDEETDLEETLRALDDLVTQGKVLYVGVSEWSAVQIQDAVALARELNLDRIVSNQPIYNMLVRYIEQDVLPVSQRYGIGQVVFSPLAQGILTGKYKRGAAIPSGTRGSDEASNHWIQTYMTDDVLAGVEKLGQVAAELGASLSQLALAWVLRQPGVSSAIIGASRPGQVVENVKASAFEIPEDALKEIQGILAEMSPNPIW